MSIFSAIFSTKKKTKKNYVISVVLTEYFLDITVFEKSQSEMIFIDSRLKEVDRESFNRISEIAEDIISPLEKNLDTVFGDVLFVIPSFAISESDSKVAQPFRSAIRQLIKDFEFNALGYVDIFEVVKIDAKANNHWLFLERGAQSANLVLCGNDNIKKRLKVTSDADEICAHIEESATKKVKIIYYSPTKYEDELTFERNLEGYSFSRIANEDIIKNIQVLLSEQFFGEQIKILEDSKLNEQVASEALAVSVHNKSDGSQLNEENLIIEQSPNTVPESDNPNKKEKLIVQNKEVNLSTEANVPTASSSDTSVLENKSIMTNSDFDDFVVYAETAKGLPEVVKHGKFDEKRYAIEETEKQSESPSEIQSQKDDDNFDDLHDDPKEEIKNEYIKSENVVEKTEQAIGRPFVAILTTLFTSWILPTVFAFGLAVFVGSIIFYHKAEVVIVVKTKSFSTDIALKNFALRALESEKDIQAVVKSSGTKEIGERAKGQVVVASFDDKIASFSAGTRLVAGDKIFRLDSDVTLEPSTVDTAQGTKVASKKTVKASATFIGPEGNLDKGVDMTVNDYPKSVYYAVSESAFSGGSKQTVPAVSQDDIDDLDVKLEALAELASKDAEMKNLKGNEIVIRTLSESSLDNVEYSAAAGDAKTEVSATGKAKYTIFYGESTELIKAVSSVVRSKLGKEYVFDQKQIDFETKKAISKSGGKSADLDLEVSVNVYLPPARESIKKSLTMLPVKSLDSKVVEPNNLSNVRVSIEPDFIPYKWLLPLFSDNIDIKIISDGGQ